MEEHGLMDMGIRNLSVRLNDSTIDSTDVNGQNLYISDHDKNNRINKGSCNEENGEKCSTTLDICDEVHDKLHNCRDDGNCSLVNGCNKLLPEDVKCVDFTTNGLSKHANIELLNIHLDQLNFRTSKDQLTISHKSRTENIETIQSSKSELEFSNNITIDNENNTALSNKELSLNQSAKNVEASKVSSEISEAEIITYLGYESEKQMPDIMRLIQKDLSEPYSIYTYRYFIHNWPKLCFLAYHNEKCVGAIVCKLDLHKKHSRRGYIAMLAVDEHYRKRKIGSNLVLKAIHAMVQDEADEVVLETEITNKPALRLYENLGFVRDKRLFRYYLNGVDALRLKLWLR